MNWAAARPIRALSRGLACSLHAGQVADADRRTTVFHPIAASRRAWVYTDDINGLSSCLLAMHAWPLACMSAPLTTASALPRGEIWFAKQCSPRRTNLSTPREPRGRWISSVLRCTQPSTVLLVGRHTTRYVKACKNPLGLASSTLSRRPRPALPSAQLRPSRAFKVPGPRPRPRPEVY
jgi:hypothetical protein